MCEGRRKKEKSEEGKIRANNKSRNINKYEEEMHIKKKKTEKKKYKIKRGLKQYKSVNKDYKDRENK